MSEVRKIIQLVKESYPLLGWKGGDGGFGVSEDTGTIILTIDCRKKRLDKTSLKKLEGIWNHKIEVYNETHTGKPFIVIVDWVGTK